MATQTLESRLAAIEAQNIVDASALTTFANFIESAPDEALFRVSPVRYGREHDLSETQAIDLFLHATRVGIFEFNWGVICPGCGAFMTTEASLSQIATEKYCALCDIDIEVALDESVEVTFTVSPTVRQIRFHDRESINLMDEVTRVFFSPTALLATNRHQAHQDSAVWGSHVPAEGSETFESSLDPGRYGFIAIDAHAMQRLEVTEDAEATEASMEFFEGRLVMEPRRLRPGKVRINIRNRSSKSLALVLGGEPPKEAREMILPKLKAVPHLTGKRLVTSQAFRDLFRTASIPAQQGLALKEVTVLFTDLRGSTALYQKVGDLDAFGLVREHFNRLHRAVIDHGGSVVKTMGDAIMATFASPLPALESALRMHGDVRTVGESGLILKVGMHAGPCIAVDLNDQLDYFGQTINLAARAQSAAGAGETIVSETVLSSEGVEGYIEDKELQAFYTEIDVRGVADPLRVCRLRNR